MGTRRVLWNRLLLGALLACGSSLGFSQEPGEEGLQRLKALMDTPVISATKTSHPASEAPGVMTIITAQDIQESGARTLADLLKRIPGVQVADNRANVLMVWIRGVTTTYNERVLLLIDGVPKRDATLSEWAPDERLDLQNVTRIEVIRGPGSALHGGNAFGGVISIYTKDYQPDQTLKVTGGTEGTAELAFQGGGLGENGRSILYSGRAFKTDGYASERGLKGAPSDNTNARSSRNLQASGSLGNGLGFHLTYGDLAYRYPMHEIFNARDAHYIYALGALTHKVEAERSAWTNKFYFDNTKIAFHEVVQNPDLSLNQVKDQDKQGMVFGLDSQWIWSPKPGRSLLLGANMEQNKATYLEEEWNPSSPSPIHPLHFYNSWFSQHGEGAGRNVARTTNWSAFAQEEEYLFERTLGITTGIRFDQFEGFGGQTSPRLAIVFQPPNFGALKLLWGKAFRPPTFRQLYVVRFDGFQPGNPNLKPERAETVELEYGRSLGSHHRVKLGWFDTTIKDAQITIADSQWQSNPIPRKLAGLELEFQSEHWLNGPWIQTISGFINAAHLVRSYDVTPLGHVDISSVARDTANVGLTLRSRDVTLFTAFNHVGRRNAGASYDPSRGVIVYTYHSAILPAYPSWKDRDNKGGYTTQDLNLTWNHSAWRGVKLELTVYNLWDKLHYNPTQDPDTYYDVVMERRRVEFKTTLRF